MGTLDPEIQTLYPFRITHAGKTVYELGALSAQARTELFEKTGEMKRRHSKTQPFSFELRACSQVSIDPSGPTINGVPVALDDPMPRIFEAPIGDANCLTIVGGRILLMGTDHGVLSVVMVELRMGTREIRKWLPKVTQMAALEDLDLLIVLANGSLFTYPLQSLLDGEKEAKSRRLAKEVLFFAVATLSDRRVLLYAKKEGPNTALHVLEQKRVGSSANKDGFFSRLSRTRTTAQDLGWEFREIDAFVMLNGCNSINIFRKHIALGTKHGFFEVLTLDRNPTRIPDLQGHDLRDLASRIKDLATVSMFWLDGNEFILVYQNCAVYVDKHGDVSRSAIMEFISQTKPVKAATMFDKYLILFTDEYVEIRDTEDGRLRQVIAGKGIKCLDYGIRGPTGDFHVAGEAAYSSSFGRAGPSTRFRKATVKFSMFLLEQPDQAVVLELVLDPEMAGASKHPPRDDLGETTEDLSSHADATAAPVSSRPGRGEGGDSPGREEQLGSTSLGLQPFTTLETFPTTTLGPFPTSHRRNAISVPHDEWNRYASPEPEGSDSETY
ncbi:CNH domain-containing protein [Phialemonium atrogriseum]|uniref:CNH domain-containing protein n=1 Tax=Phialemonium atrogriseum TaxID=1093897 RepID=A0AAJ0BSQ2_9PEZI|nr:CNH domain-containing protein [Phialemonium atrogriseum]KAK1763760.1 CNH domain-containing protein [Phialemonium atrogriseum]